LQIFQRYYFKNILIDEIKIAMTTSDQKRRTLRLDIYAAESRKKSIHHS